MKEIFLREVCETVCTDSITLNLTQLCPYWSGAETSQEATIYPEIQPDTAADILGLGRSCRHQAVSLLEHEVAAYLDNLEVGSGMLNFWQVLLYNNHFLLN